MLTDKVFKIVHDDQLPLLSPKDVTVWIKSTAYHHILDEVNETIEPMNITLYEDENNIKRAMDTNTFKETFSLLPEYKHLIREANEKEDKQ